MYVNVFNINNLDFLTYKKYHKQRCMTTYNNRNKFEKGIYVLGTIENKLKCDIKCQ